MPRSARRLLLYLASHCDLETGRITVSHEKASGDIGQSLQWAVSNTEELELAGLILRDKNRDGDRLANTYTLAGAESGWEVTIPFVRFSRHGMYELHERIIRLER